MHILYPYQSAALMRAMLVDQFEAYALKTVFCTIDGFVVLTSHSGAHNYLEI